MRLGVAEQLRYVTPGWIRWALFAALLILGVGYIAAFVLFVDKSEDFVVVAENARARAASDATPVHVPSTLVFDSSTTEPRRLGGGWHVPQPDGMWTSMHDSFIEFRVPQWRQGVALRLHLNSFLTAHTPQTQMFAQANGVKLGEWTRTLDHANESIEFKVPPDAMPGGRLRLQLHNSTLASPLALRMGPDSRPLGFKLTSIDLYQP